MYDPTYSACVILIQCFIALSTTEVLSSQVLCCSFFPLGFELEGKVKFSWQHLKTRRDVYIERLNNIYVNNLNESGVSHFNGMAKFLGRDQKGFQIEVVFRV